MIQQEIDSKLEMRESELYSLIAEDILKGSIGMAKPHVSKDEKILLGKSWFENKKHYFQDKICSDETIISLITEDNLKRKVNLISALLDLFAGLLISVSPITVAVLIVQEGIETFCNKKGGSREQVI